MLIYSLLFLLAAGAAPAIAPVPPSAVAPHRIEALSRAYLGVPYELDCLGEARLPDKDPLFTRRAADCQTLVEQVMAEAIAPHVGGLKRAIRITRYAGPVALERRYHYCIPDWVEAPWPVKDVTRRIAGRSARRVARTIDLAGLLTSRGADPALGPYRRKAIEAWMMPRSVAAARAGSLPDGSIILFVTESPAVLIGHMGFYFRKDGGTLRHASQTRKKVIDDSFGGYLKRAPKRFTGILILQPDISGLKRPAATSRSRASAGSARRAAPAAEFRTARRGYPAG